MTTTELLARYDITPAMKMLLLVLKDKALLDGSLSITQRDLFNNVNLAGQNVQHSLVILKLKGELDYEITHTPEGDFYDIQLRHSRQGVGV